MLNLYTKEGLSANEKFSVLYHDLFDYPLNFSDLIKWISEPPRGYADRVIFVTHKNRYYFLEGREGLIYKRSLRKRISAKKMKIAKRSANILSLVPGVKMVGVTGSLAMENSSEESDIDLIVITKKGLLWTTRLLAYFLIRLFGIQTRSPMNKKQKDKLCLNMWLDENDLVWRDRNLYTAHEIAQIVPLVNKNKTFEKFLYTNKWILKFWPNAVHIREKGRIKSKITFSFPVIEKLAYWFQYKYMKSKLTREVVTPTRAVFHPQDWGKVVIGRLSH